MPSLRRAWSWYEHQLACRPWTTQASSSALLWGAGDAVAQTLEQSRSAKGDLQRLGVVRCSVPRHKRCRTHGRAHAFPCRTRFMAAQLWVLLATHGLSGWKHSDYEQVEVPLPLLQPRWPPTLSSLDPCTWPAFSLCHRWLKGRALRLAAVTSRRYSGQHSSLSLSPGPVCRQSILPACLFDTSLRLST